MQVLCFILLSLVGLSHQQGKDPSKDFCRRFGHQTTVIGSKLYIDGGLINWSPVSESSPNVTNTRLIFNDLTDYVKDADNLDGFPQLHLNLSKDASVPLVSGGTLWADEANRRFFLYGGEYNSPTSDESLNLWSYDVLEDKWVQVADAGARTPQRLAWGAGAVIEDRAEGYYFGGWQSNQTDSSWDGPPLASNRMIRYNMIDNSWSNTSGPADGVRRAEGAMQYLPASDSGVLVYFGGVRDLSGNGTVMPQELDTILIYDIAGGKWYYQQATGDVPASRRRFCAGAVWAQDQSSYNIYLYGGLEVNSDSAYDDVYILTIPSFQWIRFYSAAPGEGSPHGMLTCNIAKSQMLIIGGWFPGQPDHCDAPTVWGMHNLKLGGDMGWLAYNDSITEYEVPENITNVIGGGATGGATRTSPSTWGNTDLAVYFTRSVTSALRQPTRLIPSTSTEPPPAKRTNVAAIAGGVVGGLVGLILILSLILICLRRRKKARVPKSDSFDPAVVGNEPPKYTATQRPAPTEIDSTTPIEMATSYQDLSKPQQPDIQDHPISRPYRDDRIWVEQTRPDSWQPVTPSSPHSRGLSQHPPSPSFNVPTPQTPVQPRACAAPVLDDRIMSELVNAQQDSGSLRSRFYEQGIPSDYSGREHQ